MLFNSIDFLFFFPAVTLPYFILPKKLRCVFLLAASYLFYMRWNVSYSLLLFFSTLVSYASALYIAYAKERNRSSLQKAALLCSLLCQFLLLGVFKYADFFIENVNRIFLAFSGREPLSPLSLLLPVGISFFVFQAVGYTIDVYRGELLPEKNFLRYALFVSFFPQLVAGPIERSKNLLPQIRGLEELQLWEYERVLDGLMLMLFGFFQKLVIADRAAILVKNVFQHYEGYGAFAIGLAAVCFAFKIYADFGGYTNIARGAAKVLGFSLMPNFRQPYFAKDCKDFWRRWHISLTTWFTDYVYIPLGGSRKGTLRKYFHIFVVFFFSGLWHGASWNFVAWGLLHALFRIGGEIKARVRGGKGEKGKHPLACVGTFICVTFAWVFFAADNVTHALRLFKQACVGSPLAGVSALGLSAADLCILAFAVFLLLVADALKERGFVLLSLFKAQRAWVRMGALLFLFWFTIFLGIYGVEYDAGAFIYFQF